MGGPEAPHINPTLYPQPTLLDMLDSTEVPMPDKASVPLEIENLVAKSSKKLPSHPLLLTTGKGSLAYVAFGPPSGGLGVFDVSVDNPFLLNTVGVAVHYAASASALKDGLVFVGSNDSTALLVYNINDGSSSTVSSTATPLISDIAVDLDETRIYSAAGTRGLLGIEMFTQQQLPAAVTLWLPAARESVTTVSVLPTDSVKDSFVVGTDMGRVLLFLVANSAVSAGEVSTGVVEVSTLAGPDAISKLRSRRDGRMIAVAFASAPEVRLAAVDSSSALSWRSTVKVNGPNATFDLTSDGRSLAVGDSTGLVRVLDVANADNPAKKFDTELGSPIVDIAFTPDRSRLVALDSVPELHVWGIQHTPLQLSSSGAINNALHWVGVTGTTTLHVQDTMHDTFINNEHVVADRIRLRDREGKFQFIPYWMTFDPSTMSLNMRPTKEYGGQSMSLTMFVAVEALEIQSELSVSIDIMPSLNATILEEDNKIHVQTPQGSVVVNLTLSDPDLGFFVEENIGLFQVKVDKERGTLEGSGIISDANVFFSEARIHWRNGTEGYLGVHATFKDYGLNKPIALAASSDNFEFNRAPVWTGDIGAQVIYTRDPVLVQFSQLVADPDNDTVTVTVLQVGQEQNPSWTDIDEQGMRVTGQASIDEVTTWEYETEVACVAIAFDPSGASARQEFIFVIRRGLTDVFVWLAMVIGPAFTVMGILFGLFASRVMLWHTFCKKRFTHRDVVQVRVGEENIVVVSRPNGKLIKPGEVKRVYALQADEKYKPIRDQPIDEGGTPAWMDYDAIQGQWHLHPSHRSQVGHYVIRSMSHHMKLCSIELEKLGGSKIIDEHHVEVLPPLHDWKDSDELLQTHVDQISTHDTQMKQMNALLRQQGHHMKEQEGRMKQQDDRIEQLTSLLQQSLARSPTPSYSSLHPSVGLGDNETCSTPEPSSGKQGHMAQGSSPWYRRWTPGGGGTRTEQPSSRAVNPLQGLDTPVASAAAWEVQLEMAGIAAGAEEALDLSMDPDVALNDMLVGVTSSFDDIVDHVHMDQTSFTIPDKAERFYS